MKPDPITRIVQRNLCTGCGACAGGYPALIRMVEDPKNGRRPIVENSARGRLAAKAAVGNCAAAANDWRQFELADEIDQSWGPVLATWEGWSSDGEIRHRGSSGGAVTALADYALSSGYVSGVVHIAARSDDPRLNEAVISRDRSGLLRGAGSRYAQASPAEALTEVSAGTESVAFIGKPCDIASVQQATHLNRDLSQKIPLTIAIFCAGAPNLIATERLLDRLGVPKDGYLVDLRYRGDGWPGLMQATWTDPQKQTHVSDGISYAEGWGQILQGERQWRCRVCSDHTGAFADISVGDPWHAPPKGNVDAGRSLIIARSPRGLAFVEQAIRAGRLVAQKQPRNVIAKAQPNLNSTHAAVWGRRLAMRLLGLPAPRDRGRSLFALWLRLSVKQKAQSIFGTWKRALRDRLWRKTTVRGAQPWH